MEISYVDQAARPPGSSVVTVGVFDGVHVGHRALLREVRRLADESGLEAVVVVPDRHPTTIVRPEVLPRMLTDLPQRMELLAECGMDAVHLLRFDEDRSLQPAEDFAREVLVERLGAAVQVGGEDFHFGHRRRGDAATMATIGAGLGLKVHVLHLVHDDALGGPVSSTEVRRLLREGDVETANRLLGRPHEVRGIVEHGDARGRTIGFPTANVAVAGAIALPQDGVYAGWYVDPDGTRHPSAINIGRRPTFYDENGLLLVEAHLIDFDGDLYGQHAGVQVAHHLRPEIKFPGIDALVEQLRKDVAKARQVLA